MAIDVGVPSHEAGPEPLWVQAAGMVEARIAAGALQAGEKLPAERDLCASMGISRVTLRKALQHLVARGVLTATHGRGWFVAEPPAARDWPNELESFTETARRKHMRAGSLVLRQQVRAATLDEADRLDVPAGTALLHLERLRLLDDVKIAVDRALVSVAAAPRLADVDFADRSLFDELRRQGVEPQRAETSIEAQAADEWLARQLDLEPGAPVLVLDETLFADGPRPLLWSTVRYSGERYRLRTAFRRAGSA